MVRFSAGHDNMIASGIRCLLLLLDDSEQESSSSSLLGRFCFCVVTVAGGRDELESLALLPLSMVSSRLSHDTVSSPFRSSANLTQSAAAKLPPALSPVTMMELATNPNSSPVFPLASAA